MREVAYDANGNLTKRGDQSLVWEPGNRLAGALGEGVNESYLYDADGIRVQKTGDGVATLNPFAHYEVTGGTVTKYYLFNGQRIAMRRGGTLTCLHSDHLGSVALTTNGGTIDQQYYAYGKKRGGGSLPTDHTYTGQKQDASGLLYYNARYYDPQLGAFISPDTIVPQPGVLFDYNRYMYGYGNPVKFSDPSGHCAANSSPGEEVDPDWNDSTCWALAYSIANMWDDTSYWDTRWGSRDVFMNYVAATESNDVNFMQEQLDLYLKSDERREWSAQHAPQKVTGDDWVLQNFEEYCGAHDCTEIVIDSVGTASAVGVAGACIPGFAICGAVATVGTFIGVGAGGVGVARTAKLVSEGNATEEDLIVSTATLVIGSVGPFGRSTGPITNAVLGVGASTIQMGWSLEGSERNFRRYLPYYE